MSVSNQTNKTYGSGNGVTQTFSYPFKVFNVSELYAYTINALGVVTGPLTYTTDFTATISSVTEGGTVTFVVAPPVGTTWFLKRVVPYTQSASIPSEGTFPGKQFENQLDLMTMMNIQIGETVSRCLQLPVTFTGTLPAVFPGAQTGLAIGWDANGNLVNLAVSAIGSLPVPITNGNISPLTASNMVEGSALYGLGDIPAGAGVIPAANLPVGTTAGKIVQVDGANKLPAIDGSQLTNLPGVKVYVGTFTRDVSAAGGDVSYTGIGFTPKAIIFLGCIAGAASFGVGIASAVSGNSQTTNPTGSSRATTAVIFEPVSGNYQTASIASMDADGFTLTWATKVGVPTGTVNATYLAIG